MLGLRRIRGLSSLPDPFKRLDTFARRHIGPREKDLKHMLKTVGFNTMEELTTSTVPASLRFPKNLPLASGLSEGEALAKIKSIAKKNKVLKSFIGMGYHGTVTPNVILRNLLENPGWYTAYTPYQAEIAQGRLESLLNYQTMISDLTGLPVANASLLDEGTAAAEAFNLAYGTSKGKKNKFFISRDVHPQTIDVVVTRAEALGGVEVVVGDLNSLPENLEEFYGILLQYPNTYGNISDYRKLTKRANDSKSLVIAATDLLALTHLTPPGEWGCSIAVGSAQRFGVPMMYGGPHAGFMAVEEQFMRKIPGRIIGISKDADGGRCLRMAMQTREQHIRRDKATSNLCTAQALLANIAASYAVYHGPEGLKDIAGRVHRATCLVAESLRNAGYHIDNEAFFDTLKVALPSNVSSSVLHDKAVALGLNLRQIDYKHVGISMDESHDKNDIVKLLTVFGADVSDAALDAVSKKTAGGALPEALKRKSAFLTHPVFNTYRSETQMLRYLKFLESKDFALNYCAIPLGSCTMKLNATSEMIPVTWPEFSDIHPFVPENQALGYKELVESLNATLCTVTGFAAMSAQPNSGAQGEFAGLLAIKGFHKANNNKHRNVCLIPSSAHGTNPASAVMAGMKVVVVANDADGNINFDDFKKKVELHSANLGALMVTYPSTYGVFEEKIRDIINLVHEHGGQVYMDGANMNAQVGLTSPGFIGADVCHLNLHKTFAIPHGGGGPGVGSIGVAKHLAPFLPGHAIVAASGEGTNTVKKLGGAVSSAPFGSAGILPIPWMYCNMLGGEGLKSSTQHAILNANYMKKRLEKHYKVLFDGINGQCAHEFIIDIGNFKEANVVAEDIAKRLMDYGFHAPTMSWPVTGTLMIEPTESEDLAELDRLCDALISIREEIQEIVDGKADKESNVLKNAPHPQSRVISDKWDAKYSREKAAYPSAFVKANKFWPTVGRVDNVYGDRHVVCTCPPVESYNTDS